MHSLKKLPAWGRMVSRPIALLSLLVPFSMGASDCEIIVDSDDGDDCEDAKCQADACTHDGRTYELGASFPSSDGCNQCTCTEFGVACTERACVATCGGLQGLACPEGHYCQYAPDAACGAGDQTGVCELMPEACDARYDPVCGCDGKTYGNACEAASVGVSVAARGECGGGKDGCEHGGKLYAPGDSFPDADGCNTCSCMEDGSVVCTLIGCADVCGGIAGLGCPRGTYCNYPPEAQCGNADQTGTCEIMPGACTLQYEPVCGCDGKTYGNACAAASAGVSVAAKGECDASASCEVEGKRYRVGEQFPAPDGCNTCTCGEGGAVACTEKACAKLCGGFAGFTCEDDEYCDYPKGAHCGIADQSGFCQPRPDACTKEYVPVTGCDGETYSNVCEAARAGVGVNW